MGDVGQNGTSRQRGCPSIDCRHVNDANAKHCARCGRLLDELGRNLDPRAVQPKSCRSCEYDLTANITGRMAGL